MAKRIVCVETEDTDGSHEPPHVVTIGVGSIEGSPEYTEGVEDVRRNIEDGVTYYAKIGTERAEVMAVDCTECGFETVRIGEAPGTDAVERLAEC